jgi:branched-chain amino acid transport system substrate-binding protein
MKTFQIKLILVVIFASIIIGGFGFIFGSANQVKIGIILPLTGELSDLGEGVRKSAVMAYDNLPIEYRKNIALVFEDDQFQPKQTVSAFQSLTRDEKVQAVICLASAPCKAIAPIAESKKILLIALASDSQIQVDKEYVYRLEANPREESKLLGKFIEQNNFRNIASIVAVQDGILEAYGAITEDGYFSSNEVISEKVSPETKDFRTVAVKLIKTNPDAILAGLLPGQAGHFAKQIRTLGYSGTLLGYNFIEGPESITAAGGALEGIIYTQVADQENWFREGYQNRYNLVAGPGTGHVYDAVTLIAQALNSESKDLPIFFNNIVGYHGALGTFSSTGTHEFTLPVMLKTVKGSKFVGLGE